jgi:hypothetical protein
MVRQLSVDRTLGTFPIKLFFFHLNSTLTDLNFKKILILFTPALKGERIKIFLFPLGIQGKKQEDFLMGQSRIILVFLSSLDKRKIYKHSR